MGGASKSRKRLRESKVEANIKTTNSNPNTIVHPHDGANKRPKNNHHQQPRHIVQHAVLTQYYAKIQTLRHWVLSKLPKSSKIRRKKLASIGLDPASAGKDAWSADESALGTLLDTTIVAVRHHENEGDGKGYEWEDPDQRWEQFVQYSQKGDGSYVAISDAHDGPGDLQSETVHYVIWLLFARTNKAGTWPKHMLCDGFRKSHGPRPPREGLDTATDPIPGVYKMHHNHCVSALKEPPWPQLLALFGKSGQRIMLDLLLDCAVFVAVKGGKANFNQLSGLPISDLEPLGITPTERGGSSSNSEGQKSVVTRPSEIQFIRSRMMYARAALNARGMVHFGLRHIHVLNRCPRTGPAKAVDIDQPDQETNSNRVDESVIHIMMYMFPRQFGLHNVFTSAVDRLKTAQKLQDYTLREEEIGKTFPKTADGKSSKHVPKRLRGKLPHLIERLQVLHSRCSYAEMLQHYCPLGLSKDSQTNDPTTSQPINSSDQPKEEEDVLLTQKRSLLLPSSKTHGTSRGAKKRKQSRQPPAPSAVALHYDSLVDLATPISSISAFCQAILSKIIPNEFWGQGSVQEQNKAHFLKKVDQFVCLRRFESMCLHELMQGMKITDIEWLQPPKLGNQRCSQSDTRKRAEIFYEFLYYLFDSLLIPLIRSNFYVTESNTHRYRLFFFRHDVWRQIAEPAMATLKSSMFEEVRLDDALHILKSRRLGFSQVRLLPKQMAMRPIMNLRRRTLLQGSKKILGPSINSVLGPVSNVLKLEKSLKPERLGGAMFSVGEVYQRLKTFKSRLLDRHGGKLPTLYYAKVDVQAAFDTIPQEAMVELLSEIVEQDRYKICKHVELQPVEGATTTSANALDSSKSTTKKATATTKTYKRWHTTAHLPHSETPFAETASRAAFSKNKKSTIFVPSALEKRFSKQELLALTRSHIQENLVRVGKKYWRQKRGIPQGSVLSSVLCSWFYGDLERGGLGFLREDGKDDSVLMRLIDDFLLVTEDKAKAERFVKRMHEGFERYGVKVRLEKSLANFEMAVEGVKVPVVVGGGGSGDGERRFFPYCGLLINCGTLEVGKQRGLGGQDKAVFNSLTVEYSRCPGQNFKRKVLNSFKIQSHLMFFDTSHNSAQAVLTNAYTALVETATKMWAYARCLPRSSKPSLALMQDTIRSLIDVAYLLLTTRSRKLRYPGYECNVRKTQLAWLAVVAFRDVLGRRQAGFAGVVEWLGEEGRRVAASCGGGAGGTGGLVDLRRVVRQAGSKYGGMMG